MENEKTSSSSSSSLETGKPKSNENGTGPKNGTVKRTPAPTEARQVVRQLAPRRMVVPIHFQTEPLTIQLEPVEAFLQGLAEPRRPGTNEVRVPVDAPAGQGAGPEIVVLEWRPGGPPGPAGEDSG